MQQIADLALQHLRAGRLNEAELLYRQILAQQPEHAAALHYLGVIAHQMEQHGLAADMIRHALAIAPDWPEAYNNLGVALRANGQLDEAIAACRQAIALRPNYASAYNTMANALQGKGLRDEAIAAWRQAIALQPNFPDALADLGVALKEKGQVADAIALWQQAIALKPQFPAAYNNIGLALTETHRLDEGIAAYRQALAFKPDYANAHSNIIMAMHYHPGCDAAAIAHEQRCWNQQHAQPLAKFIQPHRNDRKADRRLRIGYVSPDLRQHVVGQFLLPLLANHDHNLVEIFAYAQVPAPDDMTQRLRGYTHAWRSLVGLSDSAAADVIRRDSIDILVDLALHTANNRLLVFAHKPAPVQATYLAYAGSSGMTAMDYRLSDAYLDPPGADESNYVEKTIRLSGTYWCYGPQTIRPIQPPPSMSKGCITFGCLNNFAKVNEPLLSLWAKLLLAVPQSRLLLHAHEGEHRRRVLAYLQQQGVDPQLVSFTGGVPVAAYFDTYQSIDIALDTHPYGGGTTTCDALWMGVPVVSLAGKTAVSRAGLSILSHIGLPELVAKTAEEYVPIAVNLANDLPRLKELRSALRQRMQASPLMDAPRFARNVEAAYRQMWRKWTSPSMVEACAP